MEAAAGVAAVRGVYLPVPSSQLSRKEWRAVLEHSVRNAGNEEMKTEGVEEDRLQLLQDVRLKLFQEENSMCPLGNKIPEFNELVYQNRLAQLLELVLGHWLGEDISVPVDVHV
ncbi:hypothetical protein F0562_030535 [Nyssa sinensis]|uniref:Uncharacterized protein n=1 Tax=Nyssa sinensis TaxID=561372 RepID=A0A5J5B0U8_9ASTE|nr:hypothetical protein F0562_030535 [Nyssa sinensis]